MSDLHMAFTMAAERLAHRSDNGASHDDIFSAWDDDADTQAENHGEFHAHATSAIQQIINKFGSVEVAAGPLCELMFTAGRTFEEIQVGHLRATDNLIT